ncbi:MAG: 50S ribosomal protein L30 [Actinobacteria bacterium]|nr:50S ribosomal protein L30 [Actinomycetota bacterium]
MARLRVKQVRSGIGRPEKQKRTLRALGLTKMNSVVEHDDKLEIRGMIAKVNHLVEVEEVE